MFKNFKRRINSWYLGKFVRGGVESGVGYPGRIKRPWIYYAVAYVRREYKWIIKTVFTIIGLFIAALAVYFASRNIGA